LPEWHWANPGNLSKGILFWILGSTGNKSIFTAFSLQHIKVQNVNYKNVTATDFTAYDTRLGRAVVSEKHKFLITNREICNGFIFVQLFHMFYNIYFLFGSIVTERALKLCRFSTLIAAMSPQRSVSKVNFPTVVALEDSFLGCC